MSDEVKKMLHDLRGALSVIKSFLVAMEKVELPEDIRELRAAAERCVKKMKTIMEQPVSD